MALKDRTLLYSKKQIDDSAKVLIEATNTMPIHEAIDILNNFRSCHAYPINTFQATLRKKLKKLQVEYIISQRLKRTPSILHKINRFPSMRLSQMQDIGGLRVVLPTIDDVYRVVKTYKHAGFPHKVKNEKDYIDKPKESGYRCYHVVYEYNNAVNKNYNGLMLELQIRTRLQHAWATAVETVGTFLDHSLKSSQGPQEWLSFFALVSNAFAYLERSNGVSQFSNMSKSEVFQKVKAEVVRLEVIDKLNAFRKVVKTVDTDKRQGSLHLVVLDVLANQVNIKSYSKQAIDEASKDYMQEESKITEYNKRQVVLVSSDSIELLKKAYPSYFLDTQEFLSHLQLISRGGMNYGRQLSFYL